MNPTSDDTSSGISSNWDVLEDQIVTETKVSEKCDHLLDQCSCSLTSCSLCDSEDTNSTLESKPVETITSGGGSGTKETAGDTTPNSSKTLSHDVADYRRCCARALLCAATKLSRDSIKHLQTIALNVKDPEILSFWKSYQKSIDLLLEYFSVPAISGFLRNLAISESSAAIYLDGLETGLVLKKIDHVKESTKPAHGEVKESCSGTVGETSQVDFKTAMELKANGRYKCEWGEVEVHANKVKFLKFKSRGSQLENLLLGMPISIAGDWLNRDLKLLDKYGEENPGWCEEIENNKNTVHLTNVRAQCPINHYQWTFCNVFSQIGTFELEDPKTDGILALCGTVKASCGSLYNFEQKAFVLLEEISQVIVMKVYLKCPHARFALKYIYAAIHEGLVASWHLEAYKEDNRHRKKFMNYELNHFSEDRCFDKTFGFVPIRFSHNGEHPEFSFQFDVDINLTGGSEESTRIYQNAKWTKIPYPKPTYIEAAKDVIYAIDQGAIIRDSLFVSPIPFQKRNIYYAPKYDLYG